jgi:hypothetical protein
MFALPKALHNWWERFGKHIKPTLKTHATIGQFWARLTELDPRQPRYKLYAFINDRASGGEIKYVQAEGASTLARILIERPYHARWAVIEDAKGKALLVDMFELIMDGDDEVALGENSHWEFGSTDAAIAAAVLRD